MLNEIKKIIAEASSGNRRNLHRIIEAHAINESEANIDKLKSGLREVGDVKNEWMKEIDQE